MPVEKQTQCIFNPPDMSLTSVTKFLGTQQPREDFKHHLEEAGIKHRGGTTIRAFLQVQPTQGFKVVWGECIVIESLQNRLLKVCHVPATSASLPRVSFFFSCGH